MFYAEFSLLRIIKLIISHLVAKFSKLNLFQVIQYFFYLFQYVIYGFFQCHTLFLDTCTTLSKELCLKTSEGTIVDYMFHFLHYSNQSQPSLEAREPAIRVLTNLLKYHETSWHIWVVSP
jgi:hypothetical protein